MLPPPPMSERSLHYLPVNTRRTYNSYICHDVTMFADIIIFIKNPRDIRNPIYFQPLIVKNMIDPREIGIIVWYSKNDDCPIHYAIFTDFSIFRRQLK